MLTNNSLEIKLKDFLVVHDKGSDCSLVQVTSIDAEKIRISFNSQQSSWNSAAFTDVFPEIGYPINTSLTNLGDIADITYSLNKFNQFEILMCLKRCGGPIPTFNASKAFQNSTTLIF